MTQEQILQELNRYYLSSEKLETKLAFAVAILMVKQLEK